MLALGSVKQDLVSLCDKIRYICSINCDSYEISHGLNSFLFGFNLVHVKMLCYYCSSALTISGILFLYFKLIFLLPFFLIRKIM